MVRRVVVYMMRHEKTAGNLRRAYVGATDEAIVPIQVTPLSNEALVIYGSSRLRCQQTAALYFPHALYESYEGLTELHFGDFEMKTYEQLQHDEVYRAWIDDPFNITPPNGERFAEFTARVKQAFLHIVQQRKVYIFVVHGGVIRYMQQLAGVTNFAAATAKHHTLYRFEWSTLQAVREGQPCISFSEEPIMAKQAMPLE